MAPPSLFSLSFLYTCLAWGFLGRRPAVSVAREIAAAKNASLHTSIFRPFEPRTSPAGAASTSRQESSASQMFSNGTGSRVPAATVRASAAPPAVEEGSPHLSGRTGGRQPGIGGPTTLPPEDRSKDDAVAATTLALNKGSQLPVFAGPGEHPATTLLRHTGFERKPLLPLRPQQREPPPSETSLSLWDTEELNAGAQDNTPHTRKRRAVVQKIVKPWPCRLKPGQKGEVCPRGGKQGYFYVPIERKCKTFHNDAAEASYAWAVRYLESRTRIRFVNRTDEERYAELTCDPTYCFASVGYTVDEPEINLFPPACPNPGSILHELLHLLGLSHEHNRPDRDRYIDVDSLRAARDFDILTNVTTYGSYDFASLLHYSRHPARSKVENPFVVKNRTFTFLADYPKVFPSDCDWLALESLYPGSAPGKTRCQANCVDTSLKPTASCIKAHRKTVCDIWCAAGNDLFFIEGSCEPKDLASPKQEFRYGKSPVLQLPAPTPRKCVPYIALYDAWRASLSEVEGSAGEQSNRSKENAEETNNEDPDEEGEEGEDGEEEEKDSKRKTARGSRPTEKGTVASICPKVGASTQLKYANRVCKARCEKCVTRVFKAFAREQDKENQESEEAEEEEKGDAQWDPAPAVLHCLSTSSRTRSFTCVWSGIPHLAIRVWWCLPLLGQSLFSFWYWR